LPDLTTLADPGLLTPAADRQVVPLNELTSWHWAASGMVLALALAAVVGAARQRSTRGRGWLLVALVLFAGGQLHEAFWPSSFGRVLATSNLLRLAFAAVVVAGGSLELRRIAAEQRALLAAEQEQAARLGARAARQAEATAVVAHELATPIAAIRAYAEVLAGGPVDGAADDRVQAAVAIRDQAVALTRLVADLRDIARVDREHLALRPVAVDLDRLLAEAAAFAGTLPGDHPLDRPAATGERVRADPERIGQVFRNLLTNAANYSPPGTPIAIRVEPLAGRVRIAVADRGPGLAPDEGTEVFAKFRRGRQAGAAAVEGTGLGLYVCRTILEGHGKQLTVETTAGGGATFAFELEAAPRGAG
jgi:signal transduction histidine kinase